MTVWMALNSLGLGIVSVVLYLLLRQTGYVLRRVGPIGARGTPEGPRVGENLTHYMPELASDPLREKAKLIVFVSESCSVCAEVKRGAENLAKDWSDEAKILFVYDCEGTAPATPWKEVSRGLFTRRDCKLRMELGASFVPFAVVTDVNGTVVSKGLVNEIGHLESLLEAQQSADLLREPATDGAEARRKLRPASS